MDEKEIKKIKREVAGRYQLHIRYILLVCLLICLFVTLIVPKHVTEEAFQNFSFAATITSIVLAVVSIVYSFYSSGGIATSIGEMKQVEQELEEEIKDIPDLKKHVSETVDELKNNILEAIHADRQASDSKTEELAKSVHDMHDELAGLASMVAKESNNKNDDEQLDLFDFTINSFNGNILLYATKLAVEKGVSFNLQRVSQILGNANNLSYCRGYFVALYMCNKNRFSYDSDDNFEIITMVQFDQSYFQAQDMAEKILSSAEDKAGKDSYQNKMNEIDKYFSEINIEVAPQIDSKG